MRYDKTGRKEWIKENREIIKRRAERRASDVKADKGLINMTQERKGGQEKVNIKKNRGISIDLKMKNGSKNLE